MRHNLPTGPVTLLFTDVERSTRLLRELGAEGYADALAEHRRVVRRACAAEGGVEVDTQGDAFFFAFRSAPGAAAAARVITEGLAGGPILVRIGLHTGTPLVTEEGYVGGDVHLAARVAASGHGGQVLLSSSTRELLDGFALTELGEHLLKDIEGAVSIFQLGEEGFPPLKTISNTNLPRPASSFVGREREQGEVVGELQRGTRLLTLTGPGGSGKTRLALEAAAELAPAYKAGVFWVGLASLRDSSLLTETIAQTLGARDGLAEHIGKREMLLLLDNMEQVIESAVELSALLAACPNLALLVTSRELLRVEGEVEYEVPPLAPSEAVDLFCRRSQVEATAEIAELCSRLDDIPLAVELAAARSKVLSPGQMIERLSQRFDLLRGGRDSDPRQRTLRATIDWSYDLLSGEEQRLFRSLAVFGGGCTLAAAEEVAGAELDTLQSLVEKSLLRHSSDRFWMLETIREYARERLVAIDEERSVAERHLGYFLELVEASAAGVWRGHGEASLALDPETDNLRQALEHCRDVRAADLELRLAAALWTFWARHGQASEGRRWVEEALAAAPADKLLDARTVALVGAAELARIEGDYDEAESRGREARDLAVASGNRSLTGAALNGLAEIAIERNDLAAAAELLDEALQLARAAGERHFLAVATNNRAYTALALGDYAHGVALSEEGFALARQIRSVNPMALTLINIGFGSLGLGQRDRALTAFRDSVELTRRLGHREWIAHAAEGLAALYATTRADHALSLLAAAAALQASTGFHLQPVEQRFHDATLDTLRAKLSTETIDTAVREARSLELEQIVSLVLTDVD